MCGITGIISIGGDPIAYDQLIKMTDSLNKRGPDGEGYLISNNEEFCGRLKDNRKNGVITSIRHLQNIGLGHRRLSITDLSEKAAQPMQDVSGRYWVVFNGQIYNHKELRKELENNGYKFVSDHSDTEVILNGYACWGIECLQKFNGMWAFAIWDSVENTVFLSRDRAGKQPLYYAVSNNKFYFASEINSLMTNTEINRQINEFSVYNYLTYTFVPAPETIFKEVKKMPAAHYIYFKPGGEILAKRYWSPYTSKENVSANENEIIDLVREKLIESTRLRMPEDVNAGVLLSGGLDSSIILACMSESSGKPVKSFTVGFENKGEYKNEFTYARNVADYFKSDLSEFTITDKDFFDLLPEVTYLQDEPIADTANIPLYLISKLAYKENIKVLLSGEGADELFIGYQHWRLIYQFEKVFRQRPKLAASISYLHKKSPLKNKGQHYYPWYDKVKQSSPVFWSGTELRSEEEKKSILGAEFLSRLDNYSSFMAFEESFKTLSSLKSYETFDWMTGNDIQNRLPDLLLARLDRMMMAASVEGRNPFLDVGLIEFAFSVPAHLKVKRNTEKYLLKKAFKNILPKQILDRPKDSFTVPLEQLFKNGKKQEYLSQIKKFNSTTGFFSENYCDELIRPTRIKEFWNVLNLALWYEKHK